MVEFLDNETPLNRSRMMSLQGFEALTTEFNTDGTITETGADGVKTITFNSDGTITEVFEGERTITKTTTFNADGTISEVIS